MSDRNRNEFDFDDDFFGGDDDNTPLPGDDELPAGFGDDFEDDMPVIDQGGDEQRGGNRTFILLAAVMILLFLVGLGVVLFLATRDTGPTPNQLTATAIANQNATTVAFANETGTAAIGILNATQTAEAFTDTPSPSPSPTTPPTVTPTATQDPTNLAATLFIEQTQTAIMQAGLAAQETATAIAAQATLNAQATESALLTQQAAVTEVVQVPSITAPPISAINLTATAIAGGFLTQTAVAAGAGGGDLTPTAEGGFGTPIVRPTALPDTGLLDDVVGSGRDGIGLLALAVVGLVGVIVVSRRLRSGGQ